MVLTAQGGIARRHAAPRALCRPLRLPLPAMHLEARAGGHPMVPSVKVLLGPT